METKRTADDMQAPGTFRLLRDMAWLGYQYVRTRRIENTARGLWERNSSIRADFPKWRGWLKFFGRNECRAYIDSKLTGRDWRHAAWLIKRHGWLQRQSAKLDRLCREMQPYVRRYLSMRAARR
jgi:hypothetical protein